ncbi:MAG: hypothetical protein HZB91_09505 [Elusimicrobia bacterium]|nr:hypothetical protein [Elusimicrobiota bacterium]
MTAGLAAVAWLGASALGASAATLDPGQAARARCRLSDAAEFTEAFGAPLSSSTRRDGDLELLDLFYDNGQAVFRRPADKTQRPFLLAGMRIADEEMDIGCGGKLALARLSDLERIERFAGLSGVSLKALDLSTQKDLLRSLPFDTETQWPDRVPAGFDPDRILETGKDPGMGVRSLHREGIDGRGTSIAIIDQPLLLGHVEYRDRIVFYDATATPGVEPQMHGSPVASIAVGKTLGVAPSARLYYFAVPSWKQDNRYYAQGLEDVLRLNASLPKEDRIRVVSISFGGFKNIPNYPLWEKALRKATRQGLYVSTCSREPLSYLNLALDFQKDPDQPSSWTPTDWASKAPPNPDRLYVPGGNRTVASHRGPEVYQSDRDAGLSWSAPYLAGLAALAFQACPGITPEKIALLLKETATPMPFGRVVAPRALIERCRAPLR